MYKKIAPAGYQVGEDGQIHHKALQTKFTPMGWGYSDSGYMLRGDLGTKIHTQLGEIVPLTAGSTGVVKTKNSKNVNLRAEPCTQNCKIIGKVQAKPQATKGAILRRIVWPDSNKLDWYEVKIGTTDGKTKQGYIRSDVFQVEGTFTGQVSNGQETLEFKERYDQFCDAGTQACAETDGNTQTPLDANKKMKNSRNVVQTSGNPSVLYAFDDEGSDGQLTSVKPNLLGWMMAGIVGAAAIGFIGGHSAKGSKRNGLS